MEVFFMSRIALIGENSVSYINQLIKIWNRGHCAVLIDWRIPFKTAIEMMKETAVLECHIDRNIRDKIDLFPEDKIKYVTFDNKNSVEILPEDMYSQFHANYSRNEAVIIYSSGTTGKAKGIVLSHYAINTNADSIIDYMVPQKNDCIYIIKSLSHSSTLIGELLISLKTHTKLVISPTVISSHSVLTNIKKYRVTILCINPTLLSIYAKDHKNHNYDLSTLKKIYVSGSPLSNNIYKFARNTFKGIMINNVYGLSEAGPRITAQNGETHNNSVGKPIKGVNVIIVDNGGNPVKPNVCGIVHVKTPSKFDRYISCNCGPPLLYGDWLNTYDRGYFDENGELYIVGRVDNCFMYQSHKIYPEDIEKALLSLGVFEECLVVGNDLLIECYYTTVDQRELKHNDFIKIRSLLTNMLAPFEIPRKFTYLNQFKKTNTGKIIRKEYNYD